MNEIVLGVVGIVVAVAGIVASVATLVVALWNGPRRQRSRRKA